ncbi:MAG: hypothetical protein IPJ34_42300 [Myxococcales bacterium]|nr:hypothetical protein [Myxococcales bacterium]
MARQRLPVGAGQDDGLRRRPKLVEGRQALAEGQQVSHAEHQIHRGQPSYEQPVEQVAVGDAGVRQWLAAQPTRDCAGHRIEAVRGAVGVRDLSRGAGCLRGEAMTVAARLGVQSASAAEFSPLGRRQRSEAARSGTGFSGCHGDDLDWILLSSADDRSPSPARQRWPSSRRVTVAGVVVGGSL